MKTLLSMVNGAVQTLKGFFVKAKKANNLTVNEMEFVDNSISTTSTKAQEVLVRLMVTAYDERKMGDRNFVRVDQENNTIFLSIEGVKQTLPTTYDITTYIKDQVFLRNRSIAKLEALEAEYKEKLHIRCTQHLEDEEVDIASGNFVAVHNPGQLPYLIKLQENPTPKPVKELITGIELDRILKKMDVLSKEVYSFKWEKNVFQHIVKYIDHDLVLTTIEDMLLTKESQLNVDLPQHQTA